MFKIEIISGPVNVVDVKSYWAQIIFNNERIKFLVSLDYWQLNDYKNQWQEGIIRIKKIDKSCLIKSVYKNTDYISLFFLYRRKDKIIIQNHIIIEDLYENYFGSAIITPENCYDFIPEYHTHYKDPDMYIFDEKDLIENLKIQVTNNKPKIIHEMISVQGTLQIDDKKIDLIMPVAHWSVQDYEKQWQQGLKKINLEDVSCIVIRVFPERTIDWYLLYKKDGKVYLYRYFLVAEDYDEVIGDEKFTPENCYDFIPSFDGYQKIHAKQFAIQEWQIDLQDVYDAEIIFPK